MIFILRILRISFVRFTRILPRLAVATCAMTDIERMFRGFDWISCSWVRVKLTCAAGAARSEK